MRWGKQGCCFLFGLMLSIQVWGEESHGVVLQYHHIDTDTPFVTSTAPKDFQKHLDYIEDNGFTVWPLPKLVDHLQSGQEVPDFVVAITFDDAYISIYKNAFPLLKARGLPFTIFVSTDFVDSSAPNSLDWSHLSEMVKAGATVGNHTRTHLHIPRLLDEETDEQRLQRVRDEILLAQQRINAMVGEQPRLFAYPYGEVDPAALELLKEMKYVSFGQQSGAIGRKSDFGFLPRFPSSGSYARTQELAVKLWSLPLPVVSETPGSMILAEGETRPHLQLKIAKGSFREQQLSCYASGQGRMAIEVTTVEFNGEEVYQLETEAEHSLQPGRSRYNCTAPDRRGRRYYWYSKPWLRTGFWD